jgi:hypothetical protein
VIRIQTQTEQTFRYAGQMPVTHKELVQSVFLTAKLNHPGQMKYVGFTQPVTLLSQATSLSLSPKTSPTDDSELKVLPT